VKTDATDNTVGTEGGIRVDIPRIDEYAGLRRELEIGLTLAPTRASAVAAAKSVVAYLDDDPRVTVRLAGLGASDSRILITLAVTLGTVDEIKIAAARSRIAVTFLQRMVDEFGAYDPAFATLPAPTSFEARAAALAMASGAKSVASTVERLVAIG
jgi:hypothetical protein